MESKLACTLAFLVCVYACLTKAEKLDVAKSSNIVSNKIYQILAKDNENVLFCPLSNNLLLSLIALGSSGKTTEELRTELHLGNNDEDIKKGYEKLINDLEGDVLEVATQAFTNTGVKLNNEFAEIARHYFKSNVSQVNYGDPVGAAKIINAWVEEKTNNTIHDLIKSDGITPDMSLILVNAAHFKDNWANPFLRITDGDFYVEKNKTVPAKMMSDSDQYYYADLDDLNAKALQLFFKNPKYSMVFILPNEVDGLKELESKLQSNSLTDIISKLQSSEVVVTIPKFKIEAEMDFKSILTKMGLERLFSTGAEIRGIVQDQSLVCTKAVQKSFIDVNEHGAEASAATGYGFVPLSAVVTTEPPKEFNANHPFIFALMNENTIIFQGRLCKIK